MCRPRPKISDPIPQAVGFRPIGKQNTTIRRCWDAALDDPAFQLRCLPATEGATDDQARLCLPVSPQINSFLRRGEGGCRFRPEVRVKSEIFTPPVDLPAICQCLDDQSVSDGARAAFAAKYPDRGEVGYEWKSIATTP